MAAVGSGYDLGANTYSPAGRVFQVEYAEKAVEGSGTVIGISCKDGVVLAVEKLIHSKMLVPDSYRRIFTMSKHSGIAIGGILADGRQLVNRGREEAASYKKNFGVEIPANVMGNRISLFVHAYTEYWHLRPFGVSSLIAVYNEQQDPHLYMVDPAGECHKYFACAIGKGAQQARLELEKLKFETLTCAEAVNKAAQIIMNVHDEVKDKPLELEISWVCDASDRIHVLVPADILQKAKDNARAAKEAEDAESEDEQ